MTVDRSELADTFELLAKLCRAPPPLSVDDLAYKDALLASAQGGVRGLQRALGVRVDNIVGEETRGALRASDLSTLLHDLPHASEPAPAKPGSGLTDDLRAEYAALYAAAEVRPERKRQAADIVQRVRTAEQRTDVVSVSQQTGVPARVICIMQAMEANLDFRRHLHNGDPLSRRTVNVPADRPPAGEPPFTWPESALDALRYQKFDKWTDWFIPGCAFTFEKMNGWGYRLFHPEVKSPYLWSFSTIYSKGKYVADGDWDPNAVSEQCGAMVILKELGGI